MERRRCKSCGLFIPGGEAPSKFLTLICPKCGGECEIVGGIPVREPTKMKEQSYDIVAESLEKAWAEARVKIPQGFRWVSTNILSAGQPTTITESGEDSQSALAAAKARTAPGVRIISQKEIRPAETFVVRLSAESEALARKNAESDIEKTSVVKTVSLAIPGRKGFLGIGRTQNEYDIQILKKAVVELTYKTEAKIRVTICEERQLLLDLLGDITAELGFGRICDTSAYEPLHEVCRKNDYYVDVWGEVTYHLSPTAMKILADYGIDPRAFVEFKRKRSLVPTDGPRTCLCLIAFSIMADVFSHDQSLDEIVSVLKYASKDWHFETGIRRLAADLLMASKYPKAQSLYSVDPDKELIVHDW